MGKMFRLFGVIAVAAVIGVYFASCGGSGSPAGNGGGGDASAVVGTWSGSVFGGLAILTVTATGWALEVSDIGFYDTGTFTMRGNDAVIFDATREVGRATLVDNNTLRLILNQHSIAPGTYTLNRVH